MSTAETPTPLSPEELEELRAYYRPGYCAEPTVLGDVSRLLSTIDHYKALSTGRVDGDVEKVARAISKDINQHQLDIGFAADFDFKDGDLECDWEEYVSTAKEAIRALVAP